MMPASFNPISSVIKYLQLIVFTVLILYVGKTLFVPLFFGLLIAMIMYPICIWLQGHGIQKAMAITVCLLIVAIIFSGLLAIMVWQVKLFSKDAPAIFTKLELLLRQLQVWANDTFRLNHTQEMDWGKKISGTVAGVLSAAVQNTVSTLFMLFITPIYTALFLYHRKRMVQFLQSITPLQYQQQLHNILQQVIHTYFNYIKGMLMVYLMVGILNSIGLYLLGVQHAILFGMLCAIMTIIPYVGTFVSASLPVSLVWMQTGNFWYPLGVIGMFSFVQYLEANVIYPKAVGTQLHVSTMAMLAAMISGGVVWGIAGMVLFIPLVAILKIVSDNIPEWKPLHILLNRN